MTLAHPRRASGLLHDLAAEARVWFALWPKRGPRPQAGTDRAGRAVYVDADASLRRAEGLSALRPVWADADHAKARRKEWRSHDHA